VNNQAGSGSLDPTRAAWARCRSAPVRPVEHDFSDQAGSGAPTRSRFTRRTCP